MQSLSARLTKGSIWISASRGLVNALGFLSTIALARLLVPADFGLVAIAATMLAILNAATSMSVGQALIQHRAPTDAHLHTAWTLGVVRALLIGAVFAAIASPAAHYYGDPRLRPIIYVLSFSTVLSGFANPRLVMLQRSLVFWQDFVLNVSQKITVVVASVAIASIHHSYWALVVGTVVGQVAHVFGSYLLFPFVPRPSIRHVRELLSFSMWLTFAQLINTINWRFDQLLIGRYLGREDLGYYTVGDNLAVLPTREATLPLTQTLFPAFSSLSGNPRRLREAYQRAQALITAIALPMGVGFAFAAAPLVELVMGAMWLPAIIVIQALASVFALQTLASQAQPLGMALGQTKMLFVRDTQMLFIRVPIIVCGMYFGGLQGVVLARVLTGCVSMVVNLFIVRRLIGLSLVDQIGSNWRALSSVAVMATGVLMMQRTAAFDHFGLVAQLATTVGLGVIIYLGVSVVLWRLRGSPAGPETEVRRLVSMAARKVNRKRAA